MIVYLSYDEDYNDGGGELIATGNSGKIYTIKPTFGTFSLLDFTKNNVKHSYDNHYKKLIPNTLNNLKN